MSGRFWLVVCFKFVMLSGSEVSYGIVIEGCWVLIWKATPPDALLTNLSEKLSDFSWGRNANRQNDYFHNTQKSFRFIFPHLNFRIKIPSSLVTKKGTSSFRASRYPCILSKNAFGLYCFSAIFAEAMAVINMP